MFSLVFLLVVFVPSLSFRCTLSIYAAVVEFIVNTQQIIHIAMVMLLGRDGLRSLMLYRYNVRYTKAQTFITRINSCDFFYKAQPSYTFFFS
jgi:hypothetical protein